MAHFFKKNNNIFAFLVKASLVKRETGRTVILSQTVSVLCIIVITFSQYFSNRSGSSKLRATFSDICQLESFLPQSDNQSNWTDNSRDNF